MAIDQYVKRVFSGQLFQDGLYDDTQDYDKPNFNQGYPWAMVYFRVDSEIIIAFGVESDRQSPMRLLKKVKDYYFEVDFTIKPKPVKTGFGIKLTYYAKKTEISKNNRDLAEFPNLN
jgi:hypothetical protein